MRKCKLCNEKPADKKGSHIVPHFLSKRIDNEEGETGRDKEIGFVITPSQTNSYFGRAVLPEKLDVIYGKVTDEIIQNNNIEGIVDNYFCTSCESNLSVIESEYAITLKQKPEFDINYKSSTSGFVAFLFWTSIIWRLSIQKGSGFKLKQKEEKKINRILKKYLNKSFKKIKPKDMDIDLKNIGYKLLRSPDYSEKNWTWLHWQPSYQRPYSIMIDEYILFLYFKKTHLRGMVLDFYGSETFKKNAKTNIPFEDESIFSVSHKDYSQIVDNIKNYLVKAVDRELDINLDKIHQRLGAKGKMNPRLKLEIKRNITDSEVALGKKLTISNQAKIIYETISKFTG